MYSLRLLSYWNAPFQRKHWCQWSREASGDTHPGAQALGVNQHTLFIHLKWVLKQKFRPEYVHKCVFFEKNKTLKSPQRLLNPHWSPAAERSVPQTPALLLSPSGIALASAFLTLYAYLLLQKITEVTDSKYSFASSPFAPIFHFKLCSFLGGGVKIFFAPGHRVP